MRYIEITVLLLAMFFTGFMFGFFGLLWAMNEPIHKVPAIVRSVK